MLVRSGYIFLCAALALTMLVSCDSTDEVIEPVYSVAGSLEIDCAESDGVDSSSRTRCERDLFPAEGDRKGFDI